MLSHLFSAAGRWMIGMVRTGEFGPENLKQVLTGITIGLMAQFGAIQYQARHGCIH
jgi:hypothetical protein